MTPNERVRGDQKVHLTPDQEAKEQTSRYPGGTQAKLEGEDGYRDWGLSPEPRTRPLIKKTS